MQLIVVTNYIPGGGWEALEGYGQVVMPTEEARRFTEEELWRMAPDAIAYLAGGPLSGKLIRASGNLRIIANYGAGYERVDVEAATDCGVPVTNIPEETAFPTAEHALALMLSLSRRVAELDRKMRLEGPEGYFGMGNAMTHSLEGKTLGIVGMGRIGRQMAAFGRALRMHILYYNRRRLPPELEEDATYTTLPTLLSASDVVSLHCPLTPETEGLLGREELAMMKPSALLVNTARGKVVDNAALIAALQAHRIGGAALDVFPDEPHIPAAYLAMGQVVLAPHGGTNTHETRRRMTDACIERMIDALSGYRPQNVVNPTIYQGG